MVCKHCGEVLADSAKFCTACGAPVAEPKQEEIPVHQGQVVTASKSVSFLEAVKLAFQHYADFKGRARRSEYWWFALFNIIVSSLIGAIAPELAWIWTVVVLVPGIALVVRRLHDAGKSGWFYLWGLIPLVGTILLLIQMLKDSAPDNQWGPNPKY